MSDSERQLRDFFSGVHPDDSPDPRHRDKLERTLLVALAKKAPRRHSAPAEIWRTIMKNRTTQIATAAVVGLTVLGFALRPSNFNSSSSMSPFTLLAQASAAERSLFTGAEGITHIASEIVLYPHQQADPSELLADLEANATMENNLAFVKQWLSHRWLPVYSLRSDGQTQEHKLDFTQATDQTVTVLDLVWYEQATSRFVRVLEAADQVLFANAYDGTAVYTALRDRDGMLHVEQETVATGFQVPENPADFMGIAVGVTGSVPEKHYPPIQDVTTGKLTDGAPVRVYQLGFNDPYSDAKTGFLFKIRTDNRIVANIECLVDGKVTRAHRRLLTETVETPGLAWDLSNLAGTPEGREGVNLHAETTGTEVTVAQMAQRAASPTYVLGHAPSWTDQGAIWDLPDESSPSARMFGATYPGRDGRDVILAQGESFNRYFAAVFADVDLDGQLPWAYESENGFKAWRQPDTATEMWWTEVALKGAGFEPNPTRVGYILVSPTRTFMVLAVNGPLAEEELHALVDSLVPAAEYVGAPPKS